MERRCFDRQDRHGAQAHHSGVASVEHPGLEGPPFSPEGMPDFRKEFFRSLVEYLLAEENAVKLAFRH
jgi:hypothetical protein